MLKVEEKLNASFAAILAVNCDDVLINRLKKKSKVKLNTIWHKKDGYALDAER